MRRIFKWACLGSGWLLLVVGCSCREPIQKPATPGKEVAALQEEASSRMARENMVKHQLASRDIADQGVLDAMERVRRHLFVPPRFRELCNSYGDHPCPIGEGQTISQPYIVAYMTQALKPKRDDVVLEIGTGSGYQAAVLAELAKEVYTIEIIPSLGRWAEGVLKREGYKNAHVRIGDGYQGWPEHAPFDAVIVTCAPDHIPQPLIDQLKEGGRMIIPVGEVGVQSLVLVRKVEGKPVQTDMLPVRFVPMTGEAQKR